jgi:sec-independent protein translocase protein TatA
MGIGFRELVVILVIVLLLFGAKRLPGIMGDVAKGIKSFKDGLKGEDEKKSLPPPDDKSTV